MHLTVGYLATPTGDDGAALAAAFARTFDAEVDVVLVVRHELPDGHPGRGQYQELLIERGQQWISKAVTRLTGAAKSVTPNVLVGESFPETLMAFAEQKRSDLIVVGGARDGFFGGHVIGPVSSALLHSSSIPVALAPRGYADDPPETITAITAAVPTRPGDDNPLPFAIALARAGTLPIRMLSLVSAENLAEAEDLTELRAAQVAAARKNLNVAAHALPDAPEIESLVADGMTLESALKKLNWTDSDVLVVGSSRFAAPKRIFLGFTASRILAGVDAPVVVIPRD
ncbi:universal stress protein [Mycolicibacterium confluentis]|uniref:Universal stress protein UspA n=1 Tax=Mycolicibacterium confluentis TaxID=28047 RepID=A0A7I7Y1S1_9MYCO|nr:universal stress protein [Mycolicibacterium confluentis]MCV7319951.1 universal stress protein [Mycolicibacterium confluentis]ORV34509.1 universal stress protein UspA [Mycolicibacterium confluentis]BBZ34982.1 universal stress protein UspA [Mycolicibacterium confluentis]